jgi:hypothetical protein
MREEVISKANKKFVEEIYNFVYALLDEGKIGSDSVIKIDGTAIAPHYPRQLTNNTSLSAAVSTSEILNDIVEVLLPISIDKIMTSRLSAVGRTENLAP